LVPVKENKKAPAQINTGAKNSLRSPARVFLRTLVVQGKPKEANLCGLP
jgi:hypothetical protein